MTPLACRFAQRRATPRCRPKTGWTLVELMLGLAIAGLLLILALPFYGEWIADYQVLNHAQLLAGTMNIARAEAVKRGRRVNLCKSADRVQCSALGGWEAGYVVHVDSDRDGAVDAGDAAFRVQGPATPGITIRGNRPVDDYVSYTSLGTARLLNGGLQMGTITVCKSGRRAIDVVLANSGRARVQKTAMICP
jgi:type IV fimbrial biogenesis protein FimT